MKKKNAAELRISLPSEKDIKKIKRNPIVFVLDEILDTYNIGSLFRLADAIAARKMYLCGEMEYPPSTRIHKAAVGTENWVPWEKRDSSIEVITELKNNKYQIIAIEQDPKSVNYKNLKLDFPVALVLGHESRGISGKILQMADMIVELPMLGINKSFNVWGSAAVVSYKILENLN